MKTTQKEFFEHLAERAEVYGFKLDEGKYIREKRTGKCPVVAVAAHLGVRRLDTLQNLRAAEEIGLNRQFSEVVADAADCCEFRSFLYAARVKRLRRKLLKACGLKEVAA